MKRASILHIAEMTELLEEYMSQPEIDRITNILLRDPMNYMFLNEDNTILFMLLYAGTGIYNMHVYSEPTTSIPLKELRKFTTACSQYVHSKDPSMKGAVNIVDRSDVHIRILMRRLFNSELIKTFDNGDLMYYTDIKEAY